MKPLRLAALVLVPLIAAGCDVALGAYLASRGSDSKRAAVGPPAPDTSFSVWVANLAAGGQTDTQVRDAIILAGGEPPQPLWSKIGGFTQTTDFDLSVSLPGTWDAILISAGSNQKYLLDSVVILNDTGDPLASFAAPNFSDRMIIPVPSPTAMEGLPDGVTAETDADVDHKAFVFKRFSGPLLPLDRFRVDIWSLATGPTSGDTAWRKTVASPGEERSGGVAVDLSAVTDKVFVAYRNVSNPSEDNIEAHELGPNGSMVQTGVSLQNNVTGKVGAPSIAVASNGDVVVAHSVGAGDLRVRRYVGAFQVLPPVWSVPVANAGGTAARVEPNGLALDGSDNVLVVGGFDFGGLNGFAHFMQRYRASDGAAWASAAPFPADLANSYWRGVVASGSDDIFAVGDLSGPLPSTSLDTFVRKTSQTSLGAETWGTTINGTANQADCGNAVGVGTGGSVYVGGFVGAGAEGRNAILHKLDGTTGSAATVPWPLVFNGSGSGDDEILSMVVEGNLIYATGYETTSTQGRNLFVIKVDVGANPPVVVWKRQFDAGVGDDRGVSIKTTPTHVFVSGDVNVGAGDFDIFVWKLLK